MEDKSNIEILSDIANGTFVLGKRGFKALKEKTEELKKRQEEIKQQKEERLEKQLKKDLDNFEKELWKDLRDLEKELKNT